MLPTRFVRFFRHINPRVIRRVIHLTGERRLLGLATEMAYNNLFALFPTLIGLLAAIGTFQISSGTIDGVVLQLLPLIPQEVVTLIEEFINQTRLPQGRTVVFLSMLVAVWSASGAVSTAMNAMDQIYQTHPMNRRPFWKSKLISLLLTIAMLCLVPFASFLVFASDLLLNFTLDYFKIPPTTILRLWSLVRWIVAFGVLTAAFSTLYRFGVGYWLAGTPLVPGAVTAALLWAIVSQVMRVYLSHFNNFNLTYGTLSAGIVLMIWLNLSSLVILLGAQLNVCVGEAMQHHNASKYLAR